MSKGTTIVSGLCSVVLGILWTILLIFNMFFIFLGAWCEHEKLPDLGVVLGEKLSYFLNSWLPFLLIGVLLLILILLLVIVNSNKRYHVFMTIGVATILSAILSAGAGYRGQSLVRLLAEEWQEVLVYATVVWKDFSVIYSFVLLVLGITCVSVYFSIRMIKGEKREEDNK